jgi:hypothetical protein
MRTSQQKRFSSWLSNVSLRYLAFVVFFMLLRFPFLSHLTNQTHFRRSALNQDYDYLNFLILETYVHEGILTTFAL